MTLKIDSGRPAVGRKASPLDIPSPIKSVPIRRYGQWAAVAVLAVFAADIVVALAANEHLDYPAVAKFLTNETVMQGALVTLQLTIVSAIGGIAIGVLVAVGKMSDNRFLRNLSSAYIWFFRGVPLLVLILIWGNFAILFRTLDVGIPFTDIVFLQADTNSVITIFVAACIALSLHEGAYMAEIIRGGILSVPFGQKEAATALALSDSQIMRKIVLPQALRTIVPPLGSRVIILLKESSLVSVIAGGELMSAVTDLSATNYKVIEMLLVATIWYLVAVTLLTMAQRSLERRLSRGYSR